MQVFYYGSLKNPIHGKTRAHLILQFITHALQFIEKYKYFSKHAHSKSKLPHNLKMGFPLILGMVM